LHFHNCKSASVCTWQAIAFLASPTAPTCMSNKQAPVYSTKEKVRFALINLAIAIPLFLFARFYIIPVASEKIEQKSCATFGPLYDYEWYFFGLISLPLFIMFIFSIKPFLFYGYKVFKSEQYPLPGQKILRPTAYRYGLQAKISGMIFMLLSLCLLGLFVYSLHVCNQLLSTLDVCNTS
jgi:hypothetical protein